MENFNSHANGMCAKSGGGNELKKSFIDFIKNYCCPLKTKKSPIMCPQCP